MGNYDDCLSFFYEPGMEADLGSIKKIIPQWDRSADPKAGDFRIELIHCCAENESGGFGTPFLRPDGQIGYQLPHKHVADEYYLFVGTDPDVNNWRDLGGTCELWLGDGQDMQRFDITTPSVARIPAGTYHMPFWVKNLRRNFLMITLPQTTILEDTCDAPVPAGIDYPDWAVELYKKNGMEIPEDAGTYNPEEHTKFTHLVNECYVPEMWADVGVGSIPVMQWDTSCDPMAPFRIEFVPLGVNDQSAGFGTPFLRPTGEIGYQLPHKHVCDEYYVFIGTDPDNWEDLGAELELWLGEGEDAQKFMLDKTCVVRIPAGTYHLPYRVHNCRRNFIMLAIPMAPILHDQSDGKLSPDIEYPDWVKEEDRK